MAYEKQVWSDGDVITAEKLNYIEEGIANSENILFINATEDYESGYIVLDKTWQTIRDASLAIIINDKKNVKNTKFVSKSAVYPKDGGYEYVIIDNDSLEYTTNTANGYPQARGSV